MLGRLVAVMENGGHSITSIKRGAGADYRDFRYRRDCRHRQQGPGHLSQRKCRRPPVNIPHLTSWQPVPETKRPCALGTCCGRMASGQKRVSRLQPDSGYLVHVDIPIEGASGKPVCTPIYQSQAGPAGAVGQPGVIMGGEPGKTNWWRQRRAPGRLLPAGA